MMQTRLVTPPTLKPVSVAALKTHLRIDGADEDEYLAALIDVATQHVEERAWRALLTQTRELALDGWPAEGVIELPGAPLQSVASVKYTTAQGVEKTLDGDVYVVNTIAEPGFIKLRNGQGWPGDTLAETAAIRAQYVCGWDAVEKIPTAIVHAVRIVAGHFYENREDVVVGVGMSMMRLPEGMNALIAPFRLLRF